MVSNREFLDVTTVRTTAPIDMPGGEDAYALVFGLVGALALAALSVASLLVMARDPGIAGSILATAALVYFAGLGALLWAGAAQREAGHGR